MYLAWLYCDSMATSSTVDVNLLVKTTVSFSKLLEQITSFIKEINLVSCVRVANTTLISERCSVPSRSNRTCANWPACSALICYRCVVALNDRGQLCCAVLCGLPALFYSVVCLLCCA